MKVAERSARKRPRRGCHVALRRHGRVVAMGTWEDGIGVVELPDGRRVRGRGRRRPRGDGPDPEFGIYLLGRDPHIADWPYRWVRWRDFGLPLAADDAMSALREAHLRAASERVEISCDGGIGRTGTALSVLAILSGVPAGEAVSWVREHYDPRAVETRAQRRWIGEVAASLSGSDDRDAP